MGLEDRIRTDLEVKERARLQANNTARIETGLELASDFSWLDTGTEVSRFTTIRGSLQRILDAAKAVE